MRGDGRFSQRWSHILYLHSTHEFQKFKNILTWQYLFTPYVRTAIILHYAYSSNITSLLDHVSISN